jgi:GntR family transcriptional regulator
MLKRSPSLVEQVKTHLKERIARAEFEAGRIPSEATLAQELNVSRNTVRDALSRLEMEGVIYRKQGAGTFVNEVVSLVKTRLEEILPYESLIREHGYTPTIRLLRVDEQPAGPQLAAELKLGSDEAVLSIQKLFLADAQPVILTQTYIPKDMMKRSYTADDFQAPVYELLPKFCRQELAYYLSELVPLVVPAWLADQLDLPAQKTAVISFEEIGYNPDNEPVIKAYSYFRNDLLRLRLIRRPAASIL